MRIPGLMGKLDDSWNGPYEVNRKLNDVNYEIVVPNYRNKCKVVHINNLKTWVEQQARVLRIICVVEESSETPAKLKLLGNTMPAQGQQALTSLLNEFGRCHVQLTRQYHFGCTLNLYRDGTSHQVGTV